MVKCEFTVGLTLQREAKAIETVLCNARNPHSKSVTLSGCDLHFKRKDWGWLTMPLEWFPHQLNGGKSYTVRMPMQELLMTLKKGGKVPSDLKEIHFRTESHGSFHSSIDEGHIKQLEKKFEEMKKD